MEGRVFSRRRFLGTSGASLLSLIGMSGALASSVAGCQSVQQALGPKQPGGSAATIRFMGHFTALGDTARDRAQKGIDEQFRAKYPNITIQWEQIAWETIGEKYMDASSANPAPDISLFSPTNHTPVVRLASLEHS